MSEPLSSKQKLTRYTIDTTKISPLVKSETGYLVRYVEVLYEIERLTAERDDAHKRACFQTVAALNRRISEEQFEDGPLMLDAELFRKAVAEIERLTAAKAEWEACVGLREAELRETARCADEVRAERDRLAAERLKLIEWVYSGKAEAENQRLRAALKLIANPDNRYEGEGECEAIARKALAGAADETTAPICGSCGNELREPGTTLCRTKEKHAIVNK